MSRRMRFALLVCAATMTLAQALAQAGGSGVPKPVIEPARAGTQCIADPATMRREHPAMLEHQRDATVRSGIRGAKASLKACIACHASAETGSVAKSETNFCISCHTYTAVRIDCFGCHATRPQATAFHPILATGAHHLGALRLSVRSKKEAISAQDMALVVGRLP